MAYYGITKRKSPYTSAELHKLFSLDDTKKKSTGTYTTGAGQKVDYNRITGDIAGKGGASTYEVPMDLMRGTSWSPSMGPRTAPGWLTQQQPTTPTGEQDVASMIADLTGKYGQEQESLFSEIQNILRGQLEFGGGTQPASTRRVGPDLYGGLIGPGGLPPGGAGGQAGSYAEYVRQNFGGRVGAYPRSPAEMEQFWQQGWRPGQPLPDSGGGGTAAGGTLENTLVSKILERLESPGLGEDVIQGLKSNLYGEVSAAEQQRAGEAVQTYGGSGSYGGAYRSKLGDIKRESDLARQKGTGQIDMQSAIYADAQAGQSLNDLQTYLNYLERKEQREGSLSVEERRLQQQITQQMMNLYASKEMPDWWNLLSPEQALNPDIIKKLLTTDTGELRF